MANGVRCIGHRSVLRGLMQRAAFFAMERWMRAGGAQGRLALYDGRPSAGFPRSCLMLSGGWGETSAEGLLLYCVLPLCGFGGPVPAARPSMTSGGYFTRMVRPFLIYIPGASWPLRSMAAVPTRWPVVVYTSSLSLLPSAFTPFTAVSSEVGTLGSRMAGRRVPSPSRVVK